MEYYRYAIKRIKKFMPDIELRNIKEKDIMYLVHEFLKAEYSKSTIKSSLIVLSQAFDKAHDNGLMESNPAQKVRVPQRASEKEVRALTNLEQRSVVAACNKISGSDVILFLLETGLRREEVCNLKWIDYNKVNKYIKVTKSKTNAGIRIVPLTANAINIIARQPNINSYIFNHRKNAPHTNTSLKNIYMKIRLETGITDFTTHVCRHTFATRLIENGADAKSVSKLLGHTDVSFTLNRYTTIDDEQLRKTVERLEI